MKVAIAFGFTVIFASLSLGQSVTLGLDKSEWEISVCRYILLRSSPDFNGAVYYTVRTDKDGKIIDIDGSRNTIIGRLISTEEFIPCMKGWRLSSSERYHIAFGVGTIHLDRRPNYISVASKTKKIKILLPSEIFEWVETPLNAK